MFTEQWFSTGAPLKRAAVKIVFTRINYYRQSETNNKIMLETLEYNFLYTYMGWCAAKIVCKF